MKSKIAVLFLIVLLCLTSGCNNTSHIAEQPAPVSSSESNKAPDQSETAQAEKKTEVDRPQSTESQTDLMAQKDIVSKRTETSKLKTAIESGKRRIQDLDKLIERIYEDQVLGNISAERYARMSVNYENEQRTLINKVAEDEKKLACIEQTSLDLKTILKVLRSSTSFEELTPTLVNSLIRRIEVHNNDKSSGHCYVKVDIYFTAIGLIDIPTEDEIKSLMAKIKANPQEYRLTA